MSMQNATEEESAFFLLSSSQCGLPAFTPESTVEAQRSCFCESFWYCAADSVGQGSEFLLQLPRDNPVETGQRVKASFAQEEVHPGEQMST
jgi:hypothetical protein